MRIDNLGNYPDVGTFENIAEPLTTTSGSKAFLVSNYNGLYGVVIDGILLFVTDSYPIAAQQHTAQGRPA